MTRHMVRAAFDWAIHPPPIRHLILYGQEQLL